MASSAPTQTFCRKTTRLASDTRALRCKTTALANDVYVESRRRRAGFTNDGYILRETYGSGTTTALFSRKMGSSANDDGVLRGKVPWLANNEAARTFTF